MRACFIYEKFTQDSNPISDLGIGQKHLIKKWLEQYEILNYIINDDLTIDVEGNVFLNEGALKELKSLPDFIQFRKVSECFWIQDNKLETLKGCPEYVGDWFSCENNNLYSLKYAPKIVKGRFIVRNNPGEFTEEDVRKICITRFVSVL